MYTLVKQNGNPNSILFQPHAIKFFFNLSTGIPKTENFESVRLFIAINICLCLYCQFSNQISPDPSFPHFDFL